MTDSARVMAQVQANSRVLLALADKSDNNYASLTGTHPRLDSSGEVHL
jgi:hypothetical protein